MNAYAAPAFKAKGQWIMSFDYGEGGNFVEKNRQRDKTSGYNNKGDDFEAKQRSPAVGRRGLRIPVRHRVF